MAKTKIWPVRFSEELLDRMDAAGKKTGINRTDIIRVCLISWLDWFERMGEEAFKPPYKQLYDDMLTRLDQRTAMSREDPADRVAAGLRAADQVGGLNDAPMEPYGGDGSGNKTEHQGPVKSDEGDGLKYAQRSEKRPHHRRPKV
jgi:hypothetical protein